MGKGLRECKGELTLTTRKLPSTSQAARIKSVGAEDIKIEDHLKQEEGAHISSHP